MTNFELDLIDTRVNVVYPPDVAAKKRTAGGGCVRPACLPMSLLAAVLVLVVLLMPLYLAGEAELAGSSLSHERTDVCSDDCRHELVETIPTGLVFDGSPQHTSTADAWISLLQSARRSVDIAAFYWTLRASTADFPTAAAGQRVFDEIVRTAQRGVKITIVQNVASRSFPQRDSTELATRGLATVRSLNMTKLVGSGVLHTKFIVVDSRAIYIGSANMDWRSLAEVKELGSVITNCSCLGSDLAKIFKIYWQHAETSTPITSPLPLSWRTRFNHKHPLNVTLNDEHMQTFISSSPAALNVKGRDHDADAIVWLIGAAREHVRVAVMDYLPATLYMGVEANYYWGVLDDALRAAAFRGVRVELLISQWPYSRAEMLGYLRSLQTINSVLPRHVGGRRGSIEVRLFTVPATPEQRKIDHGRVNHNKYAVTERAAYIGTSNWAADYFITTAGVGLILDGVESGSPLVAEYTAVFDRDWTSQYARPLSSTP